MRKHYLPHFRRDMVNLMLAGASVLSLAEETSVPVQTLHRFNRQAFVEQGLVDGVNSAESAHLRATNRGIKALKKELQLVKDTSELFDGQAVVPPKDGRPEPPDQ